MAEPLDMRRALGAHLRKAFAPVVAPNSSIDAEIAALCARIDRIGGDHPVKPFRRHAPEQHR